jgi:hypothetical protein
MIAPPDFLVNLCKPWNDYYSHSKAAETIVTFLHIGGLLLAGGLAIAADRGSVRALRNTAHSGPYHLRELAAVHRWVLTGLTVVVLSGIALFAADVETFWGSWIFWAKMAMVVVLLGNGARMLAIENRLRAEPAATSPDWGRLRSSAVASLALWLIITLAGVALVNMA